MTQKPHILILGAGFGGLTLATGLDGLAAQKKINVTLIDKNPSFQMGFSMQWVMMGRRKLADGQRPYQTLAAKRVSFIQDEITRIDVGKNRVETKNHQFNYDYLVIALGASYNSDPIPGLADSAYNLCDAESVLQLKTELERLEKGTVMIAITSVPFKCPPAPYEYAFLIDDMLRRRSVRNRVKLVVTTVEPQPMPLGGQAVGDQLIKMLEERDIEFYPQYKPKQIDVRRHLIVYDNGHKHQYDVLGAMFPLQAPTILQAARLTNETGFVPVELGTFRTKVENVLAIGDVASITLPGGKPHPKAGVMAEAQAKTVASYIKHELVGQKTIDYAGQGVCFIDVGAEKAAPAEVKLLTPDGPKIIIEEPSTQGLAGKLKFEKERLERWFD